MQERRTRLPGISGTRRASHLNVLSVGEFEGGNRGSANASSDSDSR